MPARYSLGIQGSNFLRLQTELFDITGDPAARNVGQFDDGFAQAHGLARRVDAGDRHAHINNAAENGIPAIQRDPQTAGKQRGAGAFLVDIQNEIGKLETQAAAPGGLHRQQATKGLIDKIGRWRSPAIERVGATRGRPRRVAIMHVQPSHHGRGRDGHGTQRQR